MSSISLRAEFFRNLLVQVTNTFQSSVLQIEICIIQPTFQNKVMLLSTTFNVDMVLKS